MGVGVAIEIYEAREMHVHPLQCQSQVVIPASGKVIYVDFEGACIAHRRMYKLGRFELVDVVEEAQSEEQTSIANGPEAHLRVESHESRPRATARSRQKKAT